MQYESKYIIYYVRCPFRPHFKGRARKGYFKGLAGRDVKDDTRIYYIGAYPAAGPELCPYIKFACGV